MQEVLGEALEDLQLMSVQVKLIKKMWFLDFQ